MPATIRIQAEPFDAAAETAALTAGRGDIGAVVAFTGLCRDEGGRLAALELEHYPGMAEAEIGRIAAQAESRWPLLGLTVIHRFGMIRPGEEIVLVLDRQRPPPGRLRGGRLPHGLPEDPRSVLEARAPEGRHERRLGRSEGYGRPGGGKVEPIALDAVARRDEHYL